MERFLKRASRVTCCPAIDALPDELLLAVFQLPEVASKPLESVVELKSRGPAERVCHRWRQLLLHLPTSLSIELCEAHELVFGLGSEEATTASLERLLPHLSCRNITALRVTGCTEALAPHIPALLARALYPELRSLHLGGGSLLHFASFLSMCRRLETLRVCTVCDDDEVEFDPQLLCAHLCGLGCPLQLLDLTVDYFVDPLSTTISRHVRPAALALRANYPAAGMWLPQLQHCNVTVHHLMQLNVLSRGLEEGPRTQLSSLVLWDARQAAARKAAPPALRALALLPSLRKLECQGSMALSAWRCPHLTSLLVHSAPRVIPPAVGAAQCTGLRQLQLEGCTLDGGAFPASLCSALRQLSSLAVLKSGLISLPPELSQLSSLRQLVVTDASIKPPSVEAFRRLPGLTALHLRNCQLEDLPHGSYLSSLRSLDLSDNYNHLVFAIPFAATAARGLQALRIDFDPAAVGKLVNAQALHEWWQEVQWRLHCFPGLKVLAMEVNPNTAAEPEVGALLDEIRSTFPSCRLDLDGIVREHSEYSGLAEFE